MKQQVTILGATGTIGCNTLDVIKRHPDLYSVFALSANTQVELLFQQCIQFKPRYVVMVDADCAERLRTKLQSQLPDVTVLAGSEALATVASHVDVDTVMAAIVGSAGLLSTYAAAKAGKRILLANKEALVVGGQLLMDEVIRGGARLIPVDSEHNALMQCMPADIDLGQVHTSISHVTITASGGPFRTMPLSSFASITPEQACAHPNWRMGAKISIDSATMMNKGLEIIEALLLFGLSAEQVNVMIHPQSIVHALVAYHDGSVLAHMGAHDMRVAIASSLAWPDRIVSGVQPLNLLQSGQLDFQPLDLARYPCFGLVQQAIKAGHGAIITLNAANEYAVAEFIAGRIRFTDIAHYIERALSNMGDMRIETIEDIITLDLSHCQQR